MKKMIFAVGITVLLMNVMVSCKNPPIFAAIEQEVKLKPASVKSFIRGLVKIGDTLYVSNGKVFKKTFGDRGKWEVMISPGFCLSLATDGDTLYGVFDVNGTFKGYGYKENQWTEIPGIGSVKFIAGTKTVFAVEPGTDTHTVYAIKNGTVSSWKNKDILVGAVESYCLLRNGLYDEAGTLIAGSPTAGLKGICTGYDNSVLLFDDTNIHCYDGSSWTKKAHGVSAPQSITYLATKQLVLISGKSGYGEIHITGTDISTASSVKAGEAASSIPSVNYYQYKNSVGKWFLNPIHAFPYKDGYIIYTGTLDPNAKYAGLWGFYNPDQIEWNRE